MNWLITGGCGFIGTSLIKKLSENSEHSIRVLDNLSVGSRDDLGMVCSFTEISAHNFQVFQEFPISGVQLIVGDILDEALALKVSQQADIIVHLAANTGVGPSVENPRLDCMHNVLGTFNYLEAARHNGIKRFIFASSGAPAGEVEPPIHEELAPHPVSPYGASKLAGEGYCSAYKRTYGIEAIALRFGNVYGPGSKHKSSVVAKFVRQALAGETLEIYGNGNQTRDFIFIDDLINAIQLAAVTPSIGGEIFQIATNQETTVLEVSQKLVTLLRQQGLENIKLVHGEDRLGDVKRNFSDTTKARQRLGWTCQTSLDEGIERTIHYFLQQAA